MRLVRRGVVRRPAGPTLNIAPDGARYLLGDDMAANVEETKRFSPSDAAALGPFEEDLARLVRGRDPGIRLDRAGPGDAYLARPAGCRSMGPARVASSPDSRGPRVPVLDIGDAVPVGVLLLAVCARSARMARDQRSASGPSTPGTAFVLLHDHASEAARRRRAAVGVRPRRYGPRDRADGGGRSRGRLRDPHERRGRADRRPAAAPPPACGSRTARRSSAAGSCFERRPEAHVPHARRPARPAGGVPRADRGLPVHGHEHEDQPRGRRASRRRPATRTARSSPTTRGSWS